MGEKSGRGVLVEASGAVYDGQFKNNEKNGEGTYTLKDKTYKGTFQDGHFHGYGGINYGNGDVYQGNFVKDKREGRGRLQFASLNDVYEGDFVNDKM